MIGLAIWLQALLAVEGATVVCSGSSDELRLGLLGVLQAVTESRCEVVL